MPKINVYLPDDLAEAVRATGLPVSTVCQRALEQAVRRVTAIRETVLDDIDDEVLAARLPHFTARARTALRLGVDRARATGSSTVRSGDLLHGLLAEGANVALQVLPTIDIEPDRVDRELARLSLAEPANASDTGTGHGPAPRFSGPAADALELAVTESTTFGHNYVGCEHVLLGLIAEPDGVAGQLLRSLGAKVRPTRRAVTAWLAGYVHPRSRPVPDAGPVAAAPAPELATFLAQAIRQELAPVVRRIEALEGRTGAAPTA